VHGLNGGLRRPIGEQQRVTVASGVQVGHSHVALYTAQLDEPTDVAHPWMTVHAIQTEQGISQQHQSKCGQRKRGLESYRQMKQNANGAERNAYGEKSLSDSPVVAPAYVDRATP